MRRAPLVALCAALSIALLVAIVGNFGLGSKTLLGFWDCVFTPGPAPYTLRSSGVVPGGASALGSLHDGDTIDLRKLDMSAHAALPLPAVPTTYRSSGVEARCSPAFGPRPPTKSTRPKKPRERSCFCLLLRSASSACGS